MKRMFKNTYIATAVIMLAVLSSCEKHEVKKSIGNEIIIGTDFTETKALLDETSFEKSGNRIQIYDFVDNAATPYIDDLIGPDVEGSAVAESMNGVWPFVHGPHQWTAGVHKFFGWLAKDANFDNPDTEDDDESMTTEVFFALNDNSFNEATKVLSIPAKEITKDTPQFDFMYSNIVTSEPQNAPVNLEFRHLFTAVSIGVENSTSSFVKVEDFKIEGIPNKRGATINFSGTATSVGYSDWTDGVVLIRGLDEGKAGYEVSPKNLRSNIFNGSTTQEFMMLWPVEAQYLHSTEKTETTEGVVEYPESWKMYIKYTADNKTYEKRINFPNISWEAGKKYHLTIVFADKMVELKTEVKPWEYEEQAIDYTNEGVTISAGGALAWNRTVSSVEDTKKMVSIVNADPAQAQFTLQTPVGGSWIVSLTGDVNAFEVSPSTGVIDTQTATIYVRPLISSPTRDYKVQLKFTVRRSDGRMIAADNIIQANGIYTVVLPRNN